MLDEEEWLIYRHNERGYVNCTTVKNYRQWESNHPKDAEFYTVLAQGLTQKQATQMVRLTNET